MALIKQFEVIGGVWTLAPGALPRRFKAFAWERVLPYEGVVNQNQSSDVKMIMSELEPN
ncbi:hypothetical protein J6590_055146 [Homalodisca vitripennis]|nr:hypothetical protein J6590_055146 [Homalodisca vitripennis]